MKQIQKTKEPKSLIEHRANTNSSFDNLPKDELRQALLDEQGHICCYCMRRIHFKESKIEHFKCQDVYNGKEGKPDLTLNYKNLFLACIGGQGLPKNQQTCDTHKANTELSKIDLLQPVENNISYSLLGEIFSSDKEIKSDLNDDLNDVLNLNTETLKKARMEIINSVQQRRKELISANKYNIVSLQKELKHWTSKKDCMYKEYFMVAVFFLNKFIHKLKVQQNKK